MFSFRQLRTTIDHVSLLNVKDTLKSICMILFFFTPIVYDSLLSVPVSA